MGVEMRYLQIYCRRPVRSAMWSIKWRHCW